MAQLKKTDCIVIGGGIIGMSTARALALRGLSVSLFDRGQFGQEASWAAGGILSSMSPWSENADSAELSKQGQAIYANFAETLKQETSIDPEYERCGLLLVNEQDIFYMRKWAEKNQILIIDKHQEGLCINPMAILLPQIAQIRVPRLLKALKSSLSYHRVAQYEKTAITKLELKNGRFERLRAGSQYYSADAIVIAAGAWSGHLLSGDILIGDLLSKQLLKRNQAICIKPVHGQMLCVQFPSRPIKTIILDGRHYLIPRVDGHVLIGSTMEEQGFLKTTTSTARKTLMDWAYNLYPEIATANFVRHWSGLRPATDDAKPFITKLAGTENVFINAGHFRKGILQAPACATRIAGLVIQSLTN